jgi:hypothetical protein
MRLDDAALIAVADLAKIFRAETSLKSILVVGHTDSIGPDEYNYNLSVKRALAVVKALLSNGVSHELISVLGLGESYPVATNASEEGQALNRRVEFFISAVRDVPQQVVPLVPFNPCDRNNHPRTDTPNRSDAPCNTSMTEFPVSRPNAAGVLRPSGEKVSVASPPKTPVVEEVVHRRTLPEDADVRSVLPN